MSGLTEAGRRAVREAAGRYGVSEQTAEAMLHALVRGGGTMAQFNIPELGGSGQWLAGGMTMVGDMFNHGLQATVAGLASDLAGQMNAERLVEAPKTTSMGMMGQSHGWWPDGLGQPSATGGQNDIAYAVFPSTRRLAVKLGERVFLFDTREHNIGGVSQSQSGGGLSSLSFQSQFGNLALVELPRVDGGGQAQTQTQGGGGQASWQDSGVQAEHAPARVDPETPQETRTEAPRAAPPPPPPATMTAGPSTALADVDSVLRTIERLAELRDKGALTDEDYNAKKTELLSRI
ncbi:SHOCT domain-containing protein [Minwuia thermotolerans]|uniref:SHOCT domain-containing protein n=1 Tax=Minwuia thermotolerans TaxID=2056226 RepID=A0A2M9G261_9PROT|nr:SHOCT domain-containing protein [Minwuia thermotolerans]PJK29811.1 hypothetical protein CVT23_08505 [Minwuia thermotolerans]